MDNDSSESSNEKMSQAQTIESSSSTGKQEQAAQPKKPYQKPVVSKYAQIEQITFS